MRVAFFNSLLQAAEENPDIFFITADLGFGAVEPFAARFPERYLNVGVAEQNMTGIAAGLALSGHIVFTYSIANFSTLRCLEQIRNDVCYHKASVKIIGLGGGYSYGNLGMTHHATEDLAIMRALPEMTVIAPGDPVEVAAATRAIVSHAGPCYMRLGRSGEPSIHRGNIQFEIGRALVTRDGTDATFVSTGGMLPLVMGLADQLHSNGIHARVLSMHTIKPLDVAALAAAANETSAIYTFEDHSVVGGLGSAVAEWLAESGARVRFRRFGLPSSFASSVGSQSYLCASHGLAGDQISTIIEREFLVQG